MTVSAPSPIPAAFLGVAHAHVGAYAARWRARPEWGVRPAAVWDADAARAAAFAAAHGLETAASAESLLARPEVRAVVIGSETAFHADHVEQAAAAGKAIVLQKPLALTLEQGDRIVAAVERHGVPFTLAWQMRVDPHNLQIRDLLAGGRFGRLFQLRRRHCLSAHRWKGFETSWHVNPELNRDLFADDAAHPIDFVYWLLGPPAGVTAELGSLGRSGFRHDNAVALFRYPDGAFAEVSCTFCAPAAETATEIVCEKGLLVQQYGDAVGGQTPWAPGAVQLKWILEGDAAWTCSDLPVIRNQGERIAGLAEPLAAFLNGRRPALATAREGRDVLGMTLACYASAAEGRRVAFTESFPLTRR